MPTRSAPSRSPARRSAPTTVPTLPVYRGPFEAVHAERLLFRAGFGPRPGEAAKLAGLGLDGAVRSLTRPASRALVGPAPSVRGQPLAPGDAWGHEGLWWLDRMVRTQAPLVERMTLVFHDWFATSVAAVPPDLLLDQNRTIRAHSLGRFRDLVTAMTRDPAMLVWLDGATNRKGAVERELRARAARAVHARRRPGLRRARRARARPGAHGLSQRLGGRPPRAVQDGSGRARRRRQDDLRPPRSVRLEGRRPPRRRPSQARRSCRAAPVGSLRPRRSTRSRRCGARPDVSRIRRADPPARRGDPPTPRAPRGPADGQAARRLRRGSAARGRARRRHRQLELALRPDRAAPLSSRRTSRAGTPTRWIDTATWRGRWLAANLILDGTSLDDNEANRSSLAALSPAQAVDRALEALGTPTLTPGTRAGLEDFAADARRKADRPWKVAPFAVLRHNALLMLIATSPDLHTS